MSDFENELQRIRQELRSLARDIGFDPSSGTESWNQLVAASRSLGRDIRVTRLDLAAEFLGVLCERDQLLKRVSLHRATDLHGRVYDEEVDNLARRLYRDEALVRLLGKRLKEDGAYRTRARFLEYPDVPPLENGEHDEVDTLADHLLHETVEAERDRLLVEMLAGQEGVDPDARRLILDGARILQEAMLRELPPEDLKTLHTWLKTYRRTTLNYSWLSPSEDDETPIHHLFTTMRKSGPLSFDFLTQLPDNPEYADLDESTFGIWEQLAGLFGQIDFDDIIEDLKGGFLPSGPDGDDRINILPGDEKVACKPVLLAFAKGISRRDKFAFENVMKAIKQHLIDCQDIVKLVVVVTDTWDSRKFMEDHYGELSSWRRKDGVRFLFLGVGAPRDQLAPIAVDLT